MAVNRILKLACGNYANNAYLFIKHNKCLILAFDADKKCHKTWKTQDVPF